VSFRVGIGYDVHKLQEGYDLCIGGIIIDHYKGTVGHSDADVLIHAIIDALLGAAGLPDIGTWFPDNDDEFKDIDSKILLQRTIDLIGKEGYSIVNIDSTVCLQNPKIKKHIDAIKKVLAEQMGIEINQISVKATTTEKLGFIGSEEGISSRAVVLLVKNIL
jgi:2-C-methyl-D-erythritol 2,4-cyclodiphosphate synthase